MKLAAWDDFSMSKSPQLVGSWSMWLASVCLFFVVIVWPSRFVRELVDRWLSRILLLFVGPVFYTTG